MAARGSQTGGEAVTGYADWECGAASFKCPRVVAVDGNNGILVADFNNLCVRMIAGDEAQVTTVAGSSEGGK